MLTSFPCPRGATAKIAKRFIRQPRPVGSKKFEKTYGMPSTHSCSIAFFGTYLTLASLCLPFHPRLLSLLPNANHLVEQRATALAVRWSLAVLWTTAAASVCWSRVKLGHHTPAQVLVGALLGSVIALIWLSLWLGSDDYPFLRQSVVSAAGFKAYGPALERAAEDATFALLEAYEARSLDPLRPVLKLSRAPPHDSL